MTAGAAGKSEQETPHYAWDPVNGSSLLWLVPSCLSNDVLNISPWALTEPQGTDCKWLYESCKFVQTFCGYVNLSRGFSKCPKGQQSKQISFLLPDENICLVCPSHRFYRHAGKYLNSIIFDSNWNYSYPTPTPLLTPHQYKVLDR